MKSSSLKREWSTYTFYWISVVGKLKQRYPFYISQPNEDENLNQIGIPFQASLGTTLCQLFGDLFGSKMGLLMAQWKECPS